VEADSDLMLEDASSIREGLWRMARYAQDGAEVLDARIEDEDLDGRTEAEELREAKERLQAVSLEVSEELEPTEGAGRGRSGSHPVGRSAGR
jgi:hypothetical protein